MEQSCLEKTAIETRKNILPRNEYNKSDEYSDSHVNAISDGDEKGKGVGDGGYTHSIPKCNPDETTKNLIKPQLSTENGGGKYDIEGRNSIGGRNYLTAINLYNSENEYGVNSVDTTLNRLDGQIVL